MIDVKHCRIEGCTRPSIVFDVCTLHLSVENITHSLCELTDCHRTKAPKSPYCAVHKHMDTVTSPYI